MTKCNDAACIYDSLACMSIQTSASLPCNKIRIYSSQEGRCLITAAAFTKGFLVPWLFVNEDGKKIDAGGCQDILCFR